MHRTGFLKSYSAFLLVFTLSLVFFDSNGEAKTRRRVLSLGEAEPAPEEDLSGSGTVGVNKFELMTGFSSGGYTSYTNSSEIKALGSVGYLMAKNFQLGGEGGISILNYSGSSSTIIQLFVFGAYNIDSHIQTSIYLKAGLGTYSSSSSSNGSSASTSKSAIFFGAGKRFFLWPHISYSPEFRITQSDGNSIMDIKALNFSLFF